MNTIFDKIQRGTIDTGESRVFKRFDYYKRPELIKPYLHYLDANKLRSSVDDYMNDDNHTQLMYQRHFQKNKKINQEQFIKDSNEFYRESFPREVAADIYNLYYKEPERLQYEERTDSNQFRYKILDHLIDPIAKVTTKDSGFKSMMMTRSMVKYFSMLMAYQKQVEPEEFEEMQKCMNKNPDSDSGDGDSDDGDQGDDNDPNDTQQESSSPNAGKGKNKKGSASPEEILEKLLKNDKMEKVQDDLLQEAKNQINQISAVLSDEQIEQIYERSEDNSCLNGFNEDTLRKVEQEFNKIKMNTGKIQSVIKKLLDRSTNYFSGKEIITFESIFDADSLSGLEDYELLHPMLRKIMADDIMVKDIRKEGKIDLYIDQSGSMDESFEYNGQYMTKFDFSKSFAAQLFQLNLVRNIYFFNSSVHETRNGMIDILLGDTYGGTDISKVVQKVNKDNVNAIILTDAEDRCREYASKAYFIGMVGARFQYFDDNVMKKYSDNRQAILFDGKNIFDINADGEVVKP